MMRPLARLGPIAAAALAAATAFTTGCTPGDACQGAEIVPSLSPISLGDIVQRPGGTDANPASNAFTPYSWVLLLQNTCNEPLKIEKVCVVGNAHNGDDADPPFFVEGPSEDTATAGDETAVRITYDPSGVNEDNDADGARDIDQAALVVQSNATNFPTLVIPLCARSIAQGEEREALECASPVTVPAGERDDTLCN